ncbi:MAG: dTDP-4-dehydrorhamnose 3,5-epimerase [bacterium]|nr:dTDP-4-dehydrorhamnose 3,5-epimerase [bacterium]
MDFQNTKFDGVKIIIPKVFDDGRGFFLESYTEKIFQENGIQTRFVQDNHSKSVNKGVLRGLHYQKPPYAQAKLTRVIRGAVIDVIVDLRKDSATYGQWEAYELTASNFKMLYVPQGFAHGFCTIEPNTEFMYKVDNYYNQDSEDGIIWNDPTLKINWPTDNPILSDKDKILSKFSDINSPF